MPDTTDLGTQVQALLKVKQTLENRLLLHQAQERFVQDFFLQLADEHKPRRRAYDRTRLASLRASPSYSAAFDDDEPLISVIVPTYRRASSVLERSYPSLVRQSYTHWELIVVGDRMSDNMARSLRRLDASRVRFHNLKQRGRYPQRKGPCWYAAGSKPANFGLRIARGAWIAHLDDDDEFAPNHLEDLLRLARAERAEWVHGQVLFRASDGDTEVLGAPQPRLGSIARISSLYHSALKTFRYNPTAWRYLCPGDWDLWDRFLEMGVRHAHLAKVVGTHHGSKYGLLEHYGYRPVADGVLEADDNHYRRAEHLLHSGETEAAVRLLDRIIERDPLHALARNDRAGLHFNAGRDRQALELLKQAHSLQPDDFSVLRNLVMVMVNADDVGGALHAVSRFVNRFPDNAEAKQWTNELSSLIERPANGIRDHLLAMPPTQEEPAAAAVVDTGNAPEREAPAPLSIVIPVYNQVDCTRRCLESLADLAHTDERAVEILVVDDCSTDDTPELLRRTSARYAHIRFIRNPENLGFAGACNTGAAEARGQILVFLNNDTVPHPGWLEAMLAELHATDDVGVVGAKLVFPAEPGSGQVYVQHAGVAFDRQLRSLHLHKFCLASQGFLSRSRDLQAVTGAALCIRKALFEQVDGFDTDYRNGAEDLDLCFKVRRAGYRVRYCAEAVITHWESVSLRAAGQKGHNHDDRNYQLFLSRWRDDIEADADRLACEDGVSRDGGERPHFAMLSPLSPVKSGISYYTRELLPQLLRHADVDLFVDGYTPDDDWILSHCRIHDIKHLEYVNWMYDYDQIIHHIGNNKFHEAIFHAAVNHPGVVVVHEYDAKGCNDQVTTNKELLEYLIHNARGVIVHNEHSREVLRNQFLDCPMEVIPLILHDHTEHIRALGQEQAKQALGYGADDWLVVSLGLVQFHKRNHITVEGFARFARSHPRARLVLGGKALDPAYAHYLREIAASHGVEDKVHITGWLSDEDFWTHLAACDMTVNLRYPARGEESGGLYWALGCGKPALVSNYAQFSDIPDDCVVKIDFADEVEQVADALERFANNPQAGRRLGERAVAFVANRNVASRIGDLYADFALRVSDRDPKQRREHPQVAEVVWQGAFGRLTHFGRDAVLALERAGVVVAVEGIDASGELEGADPNTQTVLASMAQCTPGDVCTQIVTTTDRPFERHAAARKAVLWLDTPDAEVAATALSRGADEVWLPDDHSVRVLQRAGLPEARLQVMPLGIDGLSYGTTVYEVPATGPMVFLMPLDPSESAAWEPVIETFLQCFATCTDVKLRLFPSGGASLQDLHDAISRFAVARPAIPTAAFNSLGFDARKLNEREGPLRFWGASAFISPYSTSTAMHRVLQAQAMGLPVLTMRAGAQAEVVEAECAILIANAGSDQAPAMDTADLGEKLVWCVHHRLQSAAVGASARVRTLQSHTWRHVAERIQARLGEGTPRAHSAPANKIPVSGQGSSQTVAPALPTNEVPMQRESDAPLPRVNVIGHISGNLGIGVAARAVVQCLLDRGIEVSIIDVDPGLGRSGADPRFNHLAVRSFEELPDGVCLFVLPPPTLTPLVEKRPDLFDGSRLTAAFTMWELAVLPPQWVAALERFDLVIGDSGFIAHTLSCALSGVRVLSAAHPLNLPMKVSADRERFGLPQDGFVFLSGFEPFSDPQRKNPEAVIQAFLRTVAHDPRAHLVMKLNNADSHGTLHPVVTALRNAAGGHPRIHFFTERLDYAETLSLYASCDVFVSLHRAEGLGLSMLESMALGKPVIATGWSGNRDFMDYANSCLVSYRLVPVQGSIPVYRPEFVGEGARWAEPDINEAAQWMERLLASPSLCRRIGERAAGAAHAYIERANRLDFLDDLVAVAGQRESALRTAPPTATSTDDAHPRLYQDWLARRALQATEGPLLIERVQAWREAPSFEVFVTLRAGTEARLADSLDSLADQLYAGWRVTVLSELPALEGLAEQSPVRWYRLRPGESPASAANGLMDDECGDWVCWLPCGDQLDPRALLMVGDAIDRHPHWRVVYTDEDTLEADGALGQPAFKPDYSAELLRSWPYWGDTFFVRRDTLRTLGGVEHRPAAAYRLALRLAQACDENQIGHLSTPLVHARSLDDDAASVEASVHDALAALREHLGETGTAARAEPGPVPGTHLVEYSLNHSPLVSVIIPTRNRCDLLRACIESLLTRTEYPALEILVVDNGSDETETLDYLRSLPTQDARIRVIHYPAPYNFAAMNNAAAEQAAGDFLLLLNNDTEVLETDWLRRMVALAEARQAAVVGPRLLYLDGRVQHSGIVLGMGANGVAEHPGMGDAGDAPGYLIRHAVTREVSAVTGACLLVRADAYRSAGGLDAEELAVMYNDVDLCLRLRDQGQRILFTPHATLLHHGSASLKPEHQRREPAPARRAEMDTMLDRWLPQLADDPFYNRNLRLADGKEIPDSEICAAWEPDRAQRPRILGAGFGSDGSWHHRVIHPLAALDRGVRAQTALLPKYKDRVRVPSVAELEREQAHVLFMHNTVHDVHLEAMERFQRFNGCDMVFSQDDLMIDLPASNPYRNKVYPDMEARLRRAMACVERIIVTTEGLAQAYRGWCDDIRIVPNRLPESVWRDLRSRPRGGRKLRVGWAGAQQHAGDLMLLQEVVAQTAKHIDWVFFGLCFQEWLPHVAEVVDPVAFDRYPATLAGLGLDLAVIPLEHNRFNECKSNLKLLEFGALGVPVLCSDIEPYRGAPVSRVADRPKEWLNALGERLDQRDALVREGAALRRWVHQHWLLEPHLDEWLSALTNGEAAPTSRLVGEVS